MDDEVDDFVRRGRRGAAIRIGVLGVVVLLGSIGSYVYGRHLNWKQRNSEVRYALPDQLELFGMIGGGLGVLFLVIAVFKAVRK